MLPFSLIASRRDVRQISCLSQREKYFSKGNHTFCIPSPGDYEETRIRKTKYIISTIFFVADYVRMTALLSPLLSIQSLDAAFDRRARSSLRSRVCSLVWPLHYVRSCMGMEEQEATTERQFHAASEDTTVELRKRGEKEVFARRMKGVLADDFLPVKTTASRAMLHHAIVTFCLRAGTITDPASGSFLLLDMHTKVILLHPYLGASSRN